MKLFLTVLVFFSGIVCTAADISFVVYHSKGRVVKTSSKILLKKGDKLLLHEMLTVGEQSNVILICSNYKIIQLSKKGNYSVKSLINQCNKNASSYTNSYFKYVWDQLTHPHGSPDKQPEDYMKNVGAVSRGCNMISTNIKIDTLNYSSGNLPVYWGSSFKNPQVRIYDVAVDGGTLVKTTVTHNKPLQTGELFKGLLPGIYYWQITENDGTSCERNYVKIWPAADYKKEINNILKKVPVTTTSETAYLKGYLMEENYFLTEALQYYRQAVKENSTNKFYQKTLKKFYETIF